MHALQGFADRGLCQELSPSIAMLAARIQKSTAFPKVLGPNILCLCQAQAKNVGWKILRCGRTLFRDQAQQDAHRGTAQISRHSSHTVFTQTSNVYNYT